MNPVTVRDLAPRALLGMLVAAVAAAGAVALNRMSDAPANGTPAAVITTEAPTV